MRTGYMAIGLAAVVAVVPAAFAQNSRVLDEGKSSGTRIESEEGQTQRPGSNTGISLGVPSGGVAVGPKYLDGEPVYVRRTTVREGMTIVEVSTTRFMPNMVSNEGPAGGKGLIGRADQPASW